MVKRKSRRLYSAAQKLASAGGMARSAKLSAEQRSASSKKAAYMRWHKDKFVNAKTDKPHIQPKVTNRGDFLAWARTARQGQTCCYHEGNLAIFRQQAPLRILQLEKLSDAARPASPRPPGEAVEIENLRNLLDLARTVSLLAENGMMHLTQRRASEGVTVYLSTRTGVR